MADGTLFSVGVDSLLQAIRPYGRATSAFPPTLDESESRRSPGESLHQWFGRVVDQFCDGEPKRTAIEDHVAVFVKLSWQGPNRRQLVYANIQTVVTASDLDSDLDDYYLDSNVQAQYLRLDFDYTTLGDSVFTSLSPRPRGRRSVAAVRSGWWQFG